MEHKTVISSVGEKTAIVLSVAVNMREPNIVDNLLVSTTGSHGTDADSDKDTTSSSNNTVMSTIGKSKIHTKKYYRRNTSSVKSLEWKPPSSDRPRLRTLTRKTPLNKSLEKAQDGIETQQEDVRVEKTKVNGEVSIPIMYYDVMSESYDSEHHDPTYVCIFCSQRSHRHGLGDLFGPYWVERGRRDVWMHVDCAVWVPGVLLGSSGQVEGLEEAINQTRQLVCITCRKRGASVGCTAHGCNKAVHVHCAGAARWKLDEDMFDALCEIHKPPLLVLHL